MLLQPRKNTQLGLHNLYNRATMSIKRKWVCALGTSVDYWPVTAKYGEVHHPACSNANPNHNTNPNLNPNPNPNSTADPN